MMVDNVSVQGSNSMTSQDATPNKDPDSYSFDGFIEQMMDPDGAVVTLGAKSEGGTILGIPFGAGEVGVQVEYNQRDGLSVESNGKVTPKTEIVNTTLGGDKFGITFGGRFGIPDFDGLNTPTAGGEVKVNIGGMEFEVREGYDVDTGSTFRTYQASLPDQLAKQMPDRLNKMLDQLPDRARGLLTKAGRGPAGLVADLDVKVRITEETKANGEMTTYSGLRLEASPSEVLSIDGVLDIDKFKAIAQVDGVFIDDPFTLPGTIQRAPFALDQIAPLDTYGVFTPQEDVRFVETVDFGMSGSLQVTQDGRTIGSMETMRPETAVALQSLVREAYASEFDGKAIAAEDDAERFGAEVSARALREGMPVREASMLGADARRSREFKGDNRNAEALVADGKDNGFIDGSNLPEATIGNETFAVSTGGGVMHGRTTMTPTEIAARANAHTVNGGDVDLDQITKARADAMAQSLREGFSAKEQLAIDDGPSVVLGVPAAPGDLAASIREDLEVMADGGFGASLADREREALEGMIAEARSIEEAARFEGAKGLADNEYDVTMQVQERQALNTMIDEANKLDALADVPIPAFKPSLPASAQADGPDRRGDEIAYGRGVIENGPSGKNVAYDSFGDFTADLGDMLNGKGPKEGVATPNQAETEQQTKTDRQEGGENRGQQGNDIPEAGSKENDAATSAEFDAMGGGSNAGPESDEKAEVDDEPSTSDRDEHEGGENNGADIGDSDRNDDGTVGSDHADPGSSGIL